MAIIRVDESLCTGCGLCESTCPEVFKVSDSNIAEVIGSSCRECDLNDVATDCPVGAIEISD